MKSFKKMLVWALALSMIISLCPVSGAWAEETLSALPDTEGVTRVGIFADSHVGSENGSKNMESTLQTFSALDANYAGLAMTGDIIVQHGTVADDYKVDSAPYDYVLADLDTYANGKPYSWAMGNHEFPGACVLAVSQSESQTALMEAAIETSKEYYVDKTGMSLNDDVLIGGYHFISAAPIDYSNCFDAAAESYIMERIDAAIAADGNEKPIFLNVHHAPWYTTLSSTETVYEIPYSQTLTDYLEQHPNVIIFTGHTHNSEYDPRTIWQGGYTVVNVGHTSNGGGATVSGEIVYDRSNNEAIMMEISADNVVTLKRIDVENQCYIGEDWVLDIPNMVNNPEDENYWKYTDARYDAAPSPYFEEGAAVAQTASTTTTATLSFPQAEIDAFMGDDIIRYYNVKIVNRKLQTLVQDYDIAADFYNPPSKRANPFIFTVDELYENTEYDIEITAVSPYSKKSEIISGTAETAASSTSSTDGTATPTSPEKDSRNPVYKYVGKLENGAYAPNYSDLYTPNRNQKEIVAVADEKGNYPEGSYTKTDANGDVVVDANGDPIYYVKINWFNRNGNFGFGTCFAAMYESGNYIEFEFTVDKTGRYELMGIAANSKSSEMGVYIDGEKKGTFTIPVNESGTNGPLYDATYASAGEYILEAGTHKVKFKLDRSASAQVAFFGAALALQEEVSMIKMGYKDSTTLIHNSNCTMYDGANPPSAMVYMNKPVSFTIDVPVAGTYDIYGVYGSSGEHTFKILVDGNECFSEAVKGPIGSYKMDGSVPLTQGTHTLTLHTGTAGSYLSISELTLVREGSANDWTWQRINYNKTNTDITMDSSNGSLDNTAFGMGNGCYAAYQITPSVTGKYEFSHYLAANSSEMAVYLNGELIHTFTHNTNDYAALANATRTESCTAVLAAGMVYDVKFIKVGGGDATAVYTDIKLIEELSSGEGLYYDIFAGDSVSDNYGTQESLKYSDGRDASGYGCYGGLYAEYAFTTEYRGIYNINLVLGAGDEAGVSVYVDGVLLSTQNAEYVSGEDWTVKRNNDFGDVFLLEGEHTLKILGVDEGAFQIFKTRVAFKAEDDGRNELIFLYNANEPDDKGGSNVQVSAEGVVLGEGNSYTEYVVDVPEGNYALEICYGASDWDGRMSITVNGATLGTYKLPQNNTFIGRPTYDKTGYYTPEILCLNEGENVIKLRCEKSEDGSYYAYFSFTTFKLTRVTEPVCQLYYGEYITPDTKQTAIADGDNTVRTYLPSYVAGSEVTMLATIYEGGRLFRVAPDYTVEALSNDVLIATFNDLELDETKTYTLKVFLWDNEGSMIPITQEVSIK